MGGASVDTVVRRYLRLTVNFNFKEVIKMAIEQGVFKQTRIKRQTVKGTLAGTSGGQIMRRESSINELSKEAYDTSSEISSSQQITSVRHGVVLGNASLDGLLSPGTYSDIIGAILRRDFTAVTPMATLSLTIAGSGPTYTIARASGSYLTDGVKIGMVVRITAGSVNAANLNTNCLVTAVSALSITVRPLNGLSLVAEGPIASCTITVPGKVSYIPDAGHTNVYYTVEDWYSTNTGYSERNLDVKYGKADFALPGSGNATVKFAGNGLNQTNATSVYFTAPAAESTSEVVVAASGALIVNDAPVAVVTDLSFSIDGGIQAADGVVGSNIRPDIFQGLLKVTGSFTGYFEDGVTPALFINESKINIISALTAATDKNADFITFTLSCVKLSSSTPDDGQTGLKRTYNFTAYRNAAGGAALANFPTTVMIQDSLAA